MENKIVSYDKENDILVIHKGYSDDEKFKGNIDTGDLILDISTKGRIKGIEILNATTYLKEFHIDKKLLINLNEAEFSASVKPNGINLSIILKSNGIKNEIPAKIAVPIDTPLVY